MAEGVEQDRPSAELTQARIEAMRRKYDRKYERLQSIDTKAVQTSRTAVIILGFIASALTVSGPGAAGEVNIVSLVAGLLGSALVTVAAFLAIGLYTVTIVPEDISQTLTDPATRAALEGWNRDAAQVLHKSIGELDRQINGNQSYLEQANLALLSGIFSLLFGAVTLVGTRAFGISPVASSIGGLLVIAAVTVIARSLM
jgi:hypothetical protein